MKTNEIKCLSCNKEIKSENLKKHSNTKIHLKNVLNKVNAMKLNISL